MESGKYRSAFSDNGIFSFQLGDAFGDEGSPVFWLEPGIFIRDSERSRIWGAQYVVFITPLIDNDKSTTIFVRFMQGINLRENMVH